MKAKYNILLINICSELESIILSYLKSAFGDHYPAVSVQTAIDEKKASNYLSGNRFDLVILSNGQPLDYEKNFLKEIRITHPETNVIMIVDNQENLNQTTEFGMFHYLNKSIKNETFIQVLDDILFNSDRFNNFLEIDLAELLLALCISRGSKIITCKNFHELNFGKIYLNNGDIIHAEINKNKTFLEGEEAFLEILNWDNIKICIKNNPNTTKVTIQTDWKLILMEDLRRVYDDFIVDRFDQDDSIVETVTLNPIKELQKEQNISNELLLSFKKYLAWVPYSLKDHFVMNGFCNAKGKIIDYLRDSKFENELKEILQELTIQLIASVKIAVQPVHNNIISNLTNQFILVVTNMDNELWHFAVLQNNKKIDLLEEIIKKFPANLSKMYAQLNE